MEGPSGPFQGKYSGRSINFPVVAAISVLHLLFISYDVYLPSAQEGTIAFDFKLESLSMIHMRYFP